jgi:serine protease
MSPRTRLRSSLALATLVGGLTVAAPLAGAANRTPQAASHAGKVIFPIKPSAKAAHTVKLRKAHAVTNLSAHGGINGIEVTTGAPKVYVVFYGSQWGTQGTDANGYATFTGDPAGMAPRIQAMFKGLGTNNELWSGVQTQYCDGAANGATTCAAGLPHVGYPTGGALAGVWYDNAAASGTQVNGNTLAKEAVLAAAHFGNTTATLNRSVQYVIVSPTGTHPDGFNTATGNFCAWHDYNGDAGLTGGAAASSYGDIAFTNLPYIPDMGASCGASYVNAGAAGALDGVTIVGGHEFAETITDQNPGGGWWDNATGMENSDKCAWNGTGGTTGAQNVAFATGSFAMQSNWSNEVSACQIAHAIVTGGPAANDFSVSVSPTAATVTAGGAASATVATATTSGTAQSVALTVTGAPAGVTATLGAASVTSGTSTTLSITTTSSAVAGVYPLTITGTATSGTHTATYTLTVKAPVVNDFGIALSPTSGAVNPGASTSSTLSTSTVSGSAQTISLSVSGAPAGVTAKLGVTSLSSAAKTTTLSITTTTSAVAGVYTLTVTGTAPSGTHTATYTLTVNAPSDFSLTLNPSSGTTVAGSSTTSTVQTAVVTGSNQAVTLSATSSSSRITASFSTTSITTGGTATLTIAASSRTTKGTYTITVSARAASGTKTATYTLTV